MNLPPRLTAAFLIAIAAAAIAYVPAHPEEKKLENGLIVPLRADVTHGSVGCSPCHSDRMLYKHTPGGHTKYLWIDLEKFEASVHGKLDCAICHTSMDGGHHGAAEIPDEFANLAKKRSADPAAILACFNCHEDVSRDWKDTVHGEAIFGEGITESADCADCHGYHYIVPVHDKTSPVSIENQPYTCASCHSEVAIADRFGLARNVLKSYQGSFHGKKQEIGGMQTIAVCSSCHGVHDIYSSRDPRSLVNDRIVSATCAECHYGADYGFATAFTHNPKPAVWHRVVLTIEQIYLWLIFISMGGFALHMLLDYIRARMGGDHD